MPTYFIGNVLSPTDENQPEAHDKTFAFSKDESTTLDLTGIPIRLEHDREMEVGAIERHWTSDDGSKWVLGKIHDASLESKFAQYAVTESSTGHRYYTGLSLQHTHTQFASGDTCKEAVEVSLCCDPRRADCRIAFVDAKPDEFATKNATYKIRQFASKMASEDTKVETPEVQAPEPEKPVEPQPDTKEMMHVIVKQQQDLEEQQKKIKFYQEMEAKIEAEKKEALEKDRAKNEAAAKALVQTWASTLDKSALSDAHTEEIMRLAKEFPRESTALIRVAHHASKKYAEKEAELKKQLTSTETDQLQQNFQEAMTKQRVVHAASTKAAPEPQKTQHFMDALKQYRSAGGSVRDKMEQILDLQKPKRRRMY